MKFLWIISSFAAVVFAVSGTAFALDYKADLSLSLLEQYNDNVFLSHVAKSGDYITAVNPELMLSTQTEKADVMLKYSPSFSYYSKDTDKNDTTQQAGARGTFKLTERLSAGLTDDYLQTKDLVAIRNVEGAGPLISAQNQITMNTLNGYLAYRMSDQLTLRPSFLYSAVNNSQVGFSDIDTYTGALEASYLLSGRTTLKAKAEYDVYHYSISGDIDDQQYTIGVLHKFTPTFSIDASGGMIISHIQQPSNTDLYWVGNFTVVKSFEKGTVTFSYVNGVIPGLETEAPLRAQVFSLGYSRPMAAGALDVSIAGWYGLYKTIGNVGAVQKQDDIGGNAKISYKLFRWADVFIQYSYVNSDDKLDHNRSYNNNIISAGLKLSKQFIF